MSWNVPPFPPPGYPGAGAPGPHGGPPHPPPPPPPGFGGPHGGPPGGSPGGGPGTENSFWEFARSFDPSNFSPQNQAQPGHGVDHTAPAQPQSGSFSFGPWGFGSGSGSGYGGPPWARRGRGGPGRGGGRAAGWGPASWAGFDPGSSPAASGAAGAAASPAVEEDLYDITTAAAAAEAEMEAERAATAAADPEKRAATPSSASSGAATPSTATARHASEEHPDPPEETPEGQHCGGGACRGGGGWGYGGGGWRGRRGGPFGRGGRHGHGHHHHHHGPPPFGGGPPPFSPFFGAFGGGPGGGGSGNGGGFNLAEATRRVQEFFNPSLRNRGAAGAGGANDTGNDDQTFAPPVDVFNTRNNWTVHVALPGAKKSDIGVHWDAEHSTLNVTGIVHRPGDEEFLGSMVSGERRVGLFERKITIPPANTAAGGEGAGKDDVVDADHITAKMEDGILIVVVPKLEKEWTEIKKVDIE